MQNRFNDETSALPDPTTDPGPDAFHTPSVSRRALLTGAGGLTVAAWLAPRTAHAAPTTVSAIDAGNGQVRLDLTAPDLRGLDAWTITVADRGDTTVRHPTALQRLNGGRTVLLDFDPVATGSHARPVVIRAGGLDGRVTTTTILHPDVTAVADATAAAVVVVPASPDPTVAAATERLVDLVEQATGARLPTVPLDDPRLDDEYAEHWPIHVGNVPDPSRRPVEAALSELSDQGYVTTTDLHATTLLGTTPLATGYAVDEFLERDVGVRWLMPGEFGTHVPELSTLSLRRHLTVRQPAIASRVPHPLHTAGRNERTEVNFALGQRLHVNPAIEGYSHNLWRIFLPRAGHPSEDWGTTHPEFYPVRNGEVYVPTGQTRWQPQFTEPGTVQVTVDFILAYFEENPGATSFSLAVNDGGGFAEAEPDHPANPHRTNSFGYPDLSDIYYAWVNQVASAVAEVHPDKWLGLLAYREVADPPSFDLHERVVPYLTKERLTWLDQEMETRGKELTAGWRARASQVAFYDYAYGARYMAPRIYPHHMADYLRYGVDTGLAAYFGETDVTWGEGPKVYSITKLLWNPHQDVDRMLDDWYRHAVGAEAAPYLKKYFDHWEGFWTERIPTTDWFQTRKTITYLSFYLPSYLSAVTADDISTCEGHLAEAEQRVRTDEQRARLGVITEAFAYYKASVLSYPHPVPAPDTEDAAMALADGLESTVAASVGYASDRVERYEGWFNEYPLLWPQKHLRQFNALWPGLQPDLAWTLVDHLRAHEPSGGPVTDRLVQLAGSGTEVGARYAALVLNGARRLLVNRNPSFEAGDELPEVWQTDIRRAGDAFHRVTDPDRAHSGEASVMLEEFLAGNLQQVVQVRPGLLALRAHYRVSSDYDGVGDTWVWFDLLDERGQALRSAKSVRQPYLAARGEWTSIVMAEPVPTEIDGAAVVAARVGIRINGFQEGGRQYIDDFEVIQSAPTTPPTAAVSAVEAGPTEVRVTLDATPDRTPTAADLVLQRSHNAGPAETIEATAFHWDAESLTATATVPAIPDAVFAATPFEDHIAVSASYRDGRPAFARPYLVPGAPASDNLLTRNPSFDQWPDPDAPPTGWTLWRGSRMERSDQARSGPYALRTTGFTVGEIDTGGGGPRQFGHPITPGRHLAVMRAKAPTGTSGFVRWRIRLRDGAGAVLASLTADMVPAGSSHGEWLPVVLDVTIEEMYGGRVPAVADLYLMFKEVPTGSEVLLDDVELHRVG